MAFIRSVCVYCGSRVGRTPAHADATKELGAHMAQRGLRLVFGGGRVGLMGMLADAVLAGGGKVTGIIPEHLQDKELAHPGVDEMLVVDSMHTRKRRMFELSDAFVVLPGGLGSLDEVFEMITWKQLRLHDKPIVLANIGGYWDPFLELVRTAVSEGYVPPENTGLYRVARSIAEIMEILDTAPEPRLRAAAERL